MRKRLTLELRWSGYLLSALLLIWPVLAQTREENLAGGKKIFDEALVLFRKQDLPSVEAAREKFLAASRIFDENGEKRAAAF
jgi:hypothetical protein